VCKDVPKVLDRPFRGQLRIVNIDGLLQNIGPKGLPKSEMLMLVELKEVVLLDFPKEDLLCPVKQRDVLERTDDSLFITSFQLENANFFGSAPDRRLFLRRFS